MLEAVPREIVLLIYPRFQVLDLAGPHEVFAGANRWAGRSVSGSRDTRPNEVDSTVRPLSLATEPPSGETIVGR